MASRFLILGAVACLLWGCGPQGPARAHVEGIVTWEEKPIASGFIQFIPIPGVPGAPVQLNIKNGRYSSKEDAVDSRGVIVGENDVQIFAMLPTGKKVRSPDGDLIDEVKDSIPKKYNEETELRRDVKAGLNPFDFNLTK